MPTSNEATAPVLSMKLLMEKIQQLESQVATTAHAGTTKVQRDDMVLTKEWAQEWLSQPCADSEWVYVGTDKVTLVLESDTQRHNKHTDQYDHVPDCTLEMNRFKGPVPARFRKKYRFFCVADLAANHEVEITEADLKKFLFPEGTAPRRGTHKFEHMHGRLMRMYLEHRSGLIDPMELQGLMPLERLKAAFKAELEAEWKADEMRVANRALVSVIDERHLLSGQFDTGEFPTEPAAPKEYVKATA